MGPTKNSNAHDGSARIPELVYIFVQWGQVEKRRPSLFMSIGCTLTNCTNTNMLTCSRWQITGCKSTAVCVFVCMWAKVWSKHLLLREVPQKRLYCLWSVWTNFVNGIVGLLQPGKMQSWNSIGACLTISQSITYLKVWPDGGAWSLIVGSFIRATWTSNTNKHPEYFTLH